MLGFLPYMVFGIPVFLFVAFVLIRSLYRFVRYKWQLWDLLPFAVTLVIILGGFGLIELKATQDEGGINARRWHDTEYMGLSVLFRKNGSYTISMRGADTNAYITDKYELLGDTFNLKAGLEFANDSLVYSSYVKHDSILKPTYFVNDTSQWLYVVR